MTFQLPFQYHVGLVYMSLVQINFTMRIHMRVIKYIYVIVFKLFSYDWNQIGCTNNLTKNVIGLARFGKDCIYGFVGWHCSYSDCFCDVWMNLLKRHSVLFKGLSYQKKMLRPFIDSSLYGFRYVGALLFDESTRYISPGHFYINTV